MAEAKLKEAAEVSFDQSTDHDGEKNNNEPNVENDVTQHPSLRAFRQEKHMILEGFFQM